MSVRRSSRPSAKRMVIGEDDEENDNGIIPSFTSRGGTRGKRKLDTGGGLGVMKRRRLYYHLLLLVHLILHLLEEMREMMEMILVAL